MDVIAALPAAPRALNGQHVEPALDAAEYEEGSGHGAPLGFGKLARQCARPASFLSGEKTKIRV